jgi:hypothetical protein
MYCLGENSRDLLRKRAMFGRRASTERLFQFIGNVSTDEYAFTIDQLFSGAPCENELNG